MNLPHKDSAKHGCKENHEMNEGSQFTICDTSTKNQEEEHIWGTQQMSLIGLIA